MAKQVQIIHATHASLKGEVRVEIVSRHDGQVLITVFGTSVIAAMQAAFSLCSQHGFEVQS